MPVAWDETRLLSGYPGARATIARRAGRRWYVGSIEAGAGRAVRLPLGLPPRRAALRRPDVEDAAGGGLRARTRRVTAKRVLRLHVGRRAATSRASSPSQAPLTVTPAA